ncbi:hypothetical protein F4810DRAFT_697814 [Camillea tinctor]|nr:hypothetical protein F4810DRAFT_697814 [Camillea tinctor]
MATATGAGTLPIVTPICTGQVVDPESNPIGCNRLSDQYNVSTGDLRVATNDFFCEVNQTVCLPPPCPLAVIDSHGKTCDTYAAELSNSTFEVTPAIFFGWNQNIQGSCDDLAIDQRICLGPPSSSWTVKRSGYAPTGTSVYRTTATPARPTQPDPLSTDGLCGPSNNFATCNGTSWGDCCSTSGLCGDGPEYCGPGNCYSGDCTGPATGVTTNGLCGPLWGNLTCDNPKFGPCCSIYGHCGESKDYCGPGNCYSGACDPGVGGPSMNGE